ncbi:MAG: nuclear transport factor 2 family protein [Candidatus Acidiferrales bacterium]
MKTAALNTTARRRTIISNAIQAASSRFSRRLFPLFVAIALVLGVFGMIAVNSARASSADDAKTVAALDTQYQAAVKKGDTATMNRILADDFVLVTGSGKVYTKADMLADERHSAYEQNEDTERTVRVWGDTAVVTAKLWEKGTDNGKPFEHHVWFSDTYTRTPAGWRYVFGQSSLPLPKSQ